MCSGSFYKIITFVALLTSSLSLEYHNTLHRSISDANSNPSISKNAVIVEHSDTKRTGLQSERLTDTLWRTFEEFEELLENIVQSIAVNVPKISNDADIFLSKLRNYTIYAVEIVSNRVLDTGDQLLQGMLEDVEHQLGAVKVEFQNLALSVDEHFEWAVNQLNETLINNTVEYDWWTAHIKHRLRTVNDTQLYREGCRTIDEFIQRSNEELQNCCKISMKPVKTLCRDASSLLSESLNIIVDVIDRIQSCLEDSDSYAHYLVPCMNVAYDNISSIVTRAMQVRHLIDNMLPIKIIYTRNCFAIVMVDMKRQRDKIESNLFV